MLYIWLSLCSLWCDKKVKEQIYEISWEFSSFSFIHYTGCWICSKPGMQISGQLEDRASWRRTLSPLIPTVQLDYHKLATWGRACTFRQARFAQDTYHVRSNFYKGTTSQYYLISVLSLTHPPLPGDSINAQCYKTTLLIVKNWSHSLESKQSGHFPLFCMLRDPYTSSLLCTVNQKGTHSLLLPLTHFLVFSTLICRPEDTIKWRKPC